MDLNLINVLANQGSPVLMAGLMFLYFRWRDQKRDEAEDKRHAREQELLGARDRRESDRENRMAARLDELENQKTEILNTVVKENTQALAANADAQRELTTTMREVCREMRETALIAIPRGKENELRERVVNG